MLLDDPLRCLVAGHIEVQNPAPSMLEHKKGSRDAIDVLDRSIWRPTASPPVRAVVTSSDNRSSFRQYGLKLDLRSS